MPALEFSDVNVAFRDAQQCARACQALLETRDLRRLWTDEGPTEEAVALFADDSMLDAGERALFLAAWAFWSGEPMSLRLDELMGLEEAEPICALLAASLHGKRAVDAWLSGAYESKNAESKGETHDGMASLFQAAQQTFAPGQRHVVDSSSPADACALGAFQMAAFLLIHGVEPVRQERLRKKKTLALTREMLEMYAELARQADEREEAQKAESEKGSPRGTPLC